MPKSITFGIGAPSCSITSTFDGLRSRWITPFWCACWTARQTARNNASRSLVVIRLRSQYWVMGAPSMYSITKYGPPFGGRAGVEDLGDVRVVHHRQRLALVGEAGEHLGGVHPELDDLERHAPANGFTLLGEIHRAHTPFAQGLDDPIAAEVVIPAAAPAAAQRLSSEFVRADRTLESALDQALRAESRGIAEASSAPHCGQFGISAGLRSHFMPFAAGCNLEPHDSLFVSGEPDWTGHRSRAKEIRYEEKQRTAHWAVLWCCSARPSRHGRTTVNTSVAASRRPAFL